MKLLEKHGLDADDVTRVLEGAGGIRFQWVEATKDRPSHAEMLVMVNDQSVFVSLYPARSGDPFEWDLGTAYMMGE